MDLEKTPNSKLSPEQFTQLADRCIHLFSDNAELTMKTIIAHMVNGGSVIDLAKMWQVRYSDIMRWVRADEERSNAYNQGLADRDEWAIESILNEIRDIGHADIRLLYDAEGTLKPIKDWPDHVAKAVAGIESLDGKGGKVMKVKTIDKLKALEMYGKKLMMFIERHVVSADQTLAALISKTYQKDVDQDGE